MVRHTVLFKLDLGPAEREAIVPALEALVGVVPGLVAMRAGTDLGLADGNFDFAATADFVDENAWRGYLTHPAHLAVADGQIRPFMTARSAVQFRV